MSCRLLRNAEGCSIVPLFETSRDKAVPAGCQPWTPQTSGSSAELGDELTRLRQRVRDLESDAGKKTDEARSAGLREGEALGYEKAEAASRPMMDRLTVAISEISGLRSRIRDESEHDLVTLSLSIARRVLRREVSVDPDAIHGLVRAALDKLQARDITLIRVFPGHEDAIRRSLTAAHLPALQILSDPALSPGDVIVETSRGNLDASVDTQLSEIERGFADRLRK